MKYPKQQFDLLVRCLKVFKQHFDIEAANVHNLHFIIYQQFKTGQEHNMIYVYRGLCVKRHSLDAEMLQESTKLISFEASFELYPDGCNDSHIETAMKKAIKESL